MSAAPAPVQPALSSDTRLALRNAIKLSASLVGTWGVALVVRLWLPRYLGPERFGLLSFAEGLAASVIAFATLGIDTYALKEVAVRPGFASRFYGGTTLVRVLLALALVGVLLALPVGQRDPQVRLLLLVFAVAHFAYGLNGTLAVLLQARGTVDELAVVNVVAKLFWGAAIAATIMAGLPLVAVAVAYALSELFKTGALQWFARLRLPLQLKLEVAATREALVGAFAYFANSLAVGLGLRLDPALLGYLAHDRDVGWYTSSWSLAQISLLLVPILSSVLMPLLARSRSRSREEMHDVMRRVLEHLLALTTPVALLLALGAELWVRLAFGPAYAPAAGVLRTLAPLFVVVYLSILFSMALVVEGRGWLLTSISLAGIAMGAGMALLLVPGFDRLGPGGASTGMALASVAKELLVLSLLTLALGRHVVDRRRLSVFARTGLAALGAIGVHLALAPLGHLRLPVDLAAYVLLAVALGVLDPRSTLRLAAELRRRP